MEFADGVVLGADTRTSMGSLVVNRVTDKLTPLSGKTNNLLPLVLPTTHLFKTKKKSSSDYLMACRSGSAADTQAMTDVVKNQLEWYQVGSLVNFYNKYLELAYVLL